MKVLVACEHSATVRDAFRARGHDAWSNDLLDTEGDPRFHIKGDALDAIASQEWSLVIAHPSCTFLTLSGVRWLHTKPGRWEQMRQAAEFFRTILASPVQRIAVENPRMHGYATKIIGRKQDQIVQPWMFGHTESKGTGLWLKNLPPLRPTLDVKAQTMALMPKERDRIHWAAPGPDRWKVRSRTHQGLADAMADQWGGL